MSDRDHARLEADDPSAIRANIMQARGRMSDTLEELGTRLNPERLKQEAIHSVREATIGKVQTMAQETMNTAKSSGQRVVGLVRDNPIPAAMIAVGLGWMIWNARSSKTDGPAVEWNPPTTTDAENVTGRVAHAAQDAAHKVADTASSVASTVSDKTSQIASSVASTARAQSAKVAGAFESNPIALGAAALCLGLIAGFAIPSTPQESALFGAKRDELMEQAKDLIDEKKEQAKHVAERVVSDVQSSAQQAARDEGLIG